MSNINIIASNVYYDLNGEIKTLKEAEVIINSVCPKCGYVTKNIHMDVTWGSAIAINCEGCEAIGEHINTTYVVLYENLFQQIKNEQEAKIGYKEGI